MMPLGSDDDAITTLLAAAGVNAGDLTTAEMDLTGDMQTINALTLTNLLKASVVLARGPDDVNGNTIIHQPPSNVSPTSCAQVVVRDTAEAIRIARIADAIALRGGSEFASFDTYEALLDMVRAQRNM
jgi:hypothetical protein